MPEQVSYFHKLRFDERLKNSWIAKYLTNTRLVLLIVLSLIGLGIYSFIQIPRVLNPEVKIPIVVVTTILPGADPADVESLVTIPVEDAVRGVQKTTRVSSSSRDSLSTVTAEFQTGVDPEKARSDVQSAVDTVTNLPADGKTPKVIKIDFQNEPVWQFVVTGKSDLASLTQFSEALKEKLEDSSSIDHVDTGGIEQTEIVILIKPDAVAAYKLSPLQLSGIVKSAVSAFPAGTIKTDKSMFALSIDKQVTNVDQLRLLRVNINNTVIPLSEIATIVERSKPDQFPSYYASPNATVQRGITFNVFKRSGVNIEKGVQDARSIVSAEQNRYPGQFEVKTLVDTASEVNRQFTELVRDLAITIILIFVLLFIFLGLRQAIVASTSVPFTFFITFTIMHIMGIEFSFIAFFSLLLALGLLVDDTIVVISAMTAYHRTGRFTPLQTALLVWRDFVVAIFTTTITTVWAFLPLLLSTGIIGEFIKPIPIVVSTTLMGSFVVAMFITMPLIIFLLAPQFPRRVQILLRLLGIGILFGVFFVLIPKQFVQLQIIAFIIFLLITYRVRSELHNVIVSQVKQSRVGLLHRYTSFNDKQKTGRLGRILDQGLIHFNVFERRYHYVLDRILATSSGRRKTLIAVIVFSVFAYLLLPFGFVVNEFFPKSDQNYIFASLELPAGTSSDVTKQEAKEILEGMRSLSSVEYVSADLGRVFSGGGFSISGAGGSNTTLFTIHLVEKSKRKVTSIDLANTIRDKFKTYPKGNITIAEVSGGPPAGSDLQIKLFGDDLKILDSYANKIVAYLKNQNGVVDPDKTIKSGTGKVTFVPDLQKVADSNLSIDTLGLWLRTYASGFTLSSVKFENASTSNKEKDISMRFQTDLGTPEGISSIVIPSQQKDIPLSNLGEVKLETNPTLITREDGKRTISVTATVTKGFPVPILNQQLSRFADSLNLPAGYSWKTGGVNEENQKSVNSIIQAMLLSFLLIIVTMVLQFQSFRKAIIVMLVIPLSIAGVFIVFALTATPLSFPALIGILALFGIVVKNSILVVDKISQNERVGLPFKTAITDAATSRLEPIALTSVVAIIGLVPVTLSDPIWRGLGGAIIAGLMFSGTIMLFFIPVVYYFWFQPREKSKRDKV